jgi:transcriptional regulator with XRE-family HTH domain
MMEMTERQLIEWLREKTSQHGSMSKLARDLGVHISYLSEVLNRRRPPGAKITRGLGLKRQIIYVPMGDEDRDEPVVRSR